MRNNFEPGDYLKHKNLGLVGKFRCHDGFSGVCLVDFLDGEDKEIDVGPNYPVKLIDYAPILTWRGNIGRLKECFELVDLNYEI